jgi:hypothetical protein
MFTNHPVELPCIADSMVVAAWMHRRLGIVFRPTGASNAVIGVSLTH